MKWILQRSEEKFLNKVSIVCCEEGTELTKDGSEYKYVEVNNNRRIYRNFPPSVSREIYFYGSKDYLLLVWEKGKGLVYYVRGRGDMDMHVEFGVDLKEKQKIDYGYPYKLFHLDEIAEDEAERMSEKTEEIEKKEIQENQE